MMRDIWVVRRCRYLCAVLAFAGAMLPLAWGAPDDSPAWPSERELILAMGKGLKDRTNPGERIWVRGMHEMNVGKNEDALLVSVWLPDRGRNFSAGTFLYRPKLKQARELNYSQSLGVIYVTGHHGKFGLLEQSGSGQGTEDFTHALVRFDGWRLQVLHEVSFGSNLGDCGSAALTPKVCEQTWVKFQLLPDQSSEGVDLIEVTTRMIGPDRLDGKVSVTSRRMRLKGNRFMAVEN